MTHHHHHEHEIKSDLSLQEKMAKLLDHWIKHNSEHADNNYRNWAIRAKDENMAEVASLLEDAASLTLDISNKFKKAISEIELETEE